MSKILVFGATGYTGELTARHLVADGERPTLVARRAEPLKALADELGGLDVAVADASDQAALAAVVEPGDVLIATVGPFLRHGRTAVQVAAEAGAHYLDSTGEGTFIREVFERWGPIAAGNGTAMLSAFGFDFVPGSLAGALALEKAGVEATSVDVAYFAFDVGISGGTKASIAGMMLEEGFGWRDGALRPERAGRRIERFDVDSKSMTGVSIPGSEHLALPASYPQLRDVSVFLGVPPAAARLMSAGGLVSTPARRIAPLKRMALAGVGRVVKGSTGGPEPRLGPGHGASWSASPAPPPARCSPPPRSAARTPTTTPPPSSPGARGRSRPVACREWVAWDRSAPSASRLCAPAVPRRVSSRAELPG